MTDTVSPRAVIARVRSRRRLGIRKSRKMRWPGGDPVVYQGRGAFPERAVLDYEGKILYSDEEEL